MFVITYRSFGLYALGRFVSILGSGIQSIAIVLYILDTTGSGIAMGIFAMLRTIPGLIFLPFTGVVADRWNRKYIMIISDLLNGFLIFGLMMLVMVNSLSIKYLFIAQVFMSVFNIFFRSATRAMIPELIPVEELTKGNSIIKGIENVSSILGPIIGATIYGLGGIKIIFLINCISFLLSGVSEIFIKYTNKISQELKTGTKDIVKDMKEGFRYILSNKYIKTLCFFYIISCAIQIPFMSVFLPYLYKEQIGFSGHQFAILETSFVIGMFIGSVLLASFFSKVDSQKLITVGLIIYSLAMITHAVFALPGVINYTGPSWLLMGVFGFCIMTMGVCDVIYDAPIESNLQQMTPNEMRGRVMSALQMFFGLGIPVGEFLYGYLLDRISAHTIILVASMIYFIACIVFLSTSAKVMTNMDSKVADI